ncbi:sigma-70 family RNA polymerase sigma factor [Micromonospora sp. WMMD882]|uniref:sigma-70 family RNA polymerase sigma factor n=1 Tax=Micromonospora sp. WMMD882 TaxID=3015151 RepID=UPI00248BE5DC|nr:sigma-70 family RNA polymerase sigma factor [Micromonospora sp. WMMD882]WBB81179.1 sigma-70 family RNA polymerase sigma factor [Micromonospora sp. WMMD882]
MFAERADDETVTRLALAAKTGDRPAATRFIEVTHRDVHRFLAFLVHPGEADDLTQETYLRAMRALPRFAARSTARTWLLAIARRVAADHLRTASRRPPQTRLDDWQAAAEVAAFRQGGLGLDEQVALRDLLDGLAPARREAFIATQLLGLSYTEAAQVCDCPVGTIRSRVARAREDLVAGMRDSTHDGRRATG